MKMTMVQGVLGALHRHLAAESEETEHGEKQMKIEDPHIKVDLGESHKKPAY